MKTKKNLIWLVLLIVLVVLTLANWTDLAEEFKNDLNYVAE